MLSSISAPSVPSEQYWASRVSKVINCPKKSLFYTQKKKRERQLQSLKVGNSSLCLCLPFSLQQLLSGHGAGGSQLLLQPLACRIRLACKRPGPLRLPYPDSLSASSFSLAALSAGSAKLPESTGAASSAVYGPGCSLSLLVSGFSSSSWTSEVGIFRAGTRLPPTIQKEYRLEKCCTAAASSHHGPGLTG